ncbi:translation initiation factor IF-3 C-terminal domain-containing protein [Nocardioides convexus]|uniref:translation initiation factor IF-3 n=1 Tax=Nocardioides convexus TaxID=2712224 RepID=UPI002418A314|nr:translation initiation factor IF-3 C-terminal domain-containing protein [Nocardioides convexus]
MDAHDYETKKGHVVRFLKAGDKVKITIMFRGREQHRPELGYRLLQKAGRGRHGASASWSPTPSRTAAT